MFVSIVSDRGCTSEEDMYQRLVRCDTDKLWSELGELISRYDAGEFDGPAR